MAEIAAIIGIIVTLIVEAIVATVFVVTMKGDIRVNSQVSEGLQKQIDALNLCLSDYRARHENDHKEIADRTFENQRKISNVEENIEFIKQMLVDIKKQIEENKK